MQCNSCVQPLLLNKMSYVYVASLQFVPITEQQSLCGHTTICLSRVGKHWTLACFQFLLIVDKPVINIHLLLLCVFISLKYMPKSRTAESFSHSVFNILRQICHYCFFYSISHQKQPCCHLFRRGERGLDFVW